MNTIVLGILGGGQLGRMSAMEAARLGISCVIYTPEENSPASQVVAETIVAAYDDKSALKTFADKVHFISYEFENIPVETIRYLKQLKPVYPDEQLLEISQDRIAEKSFLNEIGIKTTRWTRVDSVQDIDRAFQGWGCQSGILKTTRFGYDGKGQQWVHAGQDIEQSLSAFSGQQLILEEPVDFSCEISVIVCRDQSGSIEFFGPVLNEHKNHILDRSFYPAPIDPALQVKAIEMSKNLAEKTNLVGVLTLEMFVSKDGDILANEIAPRTHNSGHWTLDACAVSQFENHVRAVCGLPLGQPMPHSDAEMINLVGDTVKIAQDHLKQPHSCVHIYGKKEIREGRKLGHITLLKNQNKETKDLP